MVLAQWCVQEQSRQCLKESCCRLRLGFLGLASRICKEEAAQETFLELEDVTLVGGARLRAD